MNELDLLQIFTAEGKDLDWWQMGVRAVLVYGITLIIIRLGKKRLLGKSAAMDVVLGVILGSVMSRSINGSATLFPTAIASFAFVLLHALSAKVSLHSPTLGKWLKGEPHLLVKDGQVIEEATERSDISKHDIEESARVEGKISGIEHIAEAHLERNGKISIIPAKQPLRIIEIKVEDGVQTVRLEV
ncbi:DUF421 domain-containing protein [Verrucomicrobiota bacterium sgz303538]